MPTAGNTLEDGISPVMGPVADWQVAGLGVELVEVIHEQLPHAVVCPIPLSKLWALSPFLAESPCWVTSHFVSF